jgi:hypothetical protein
MISEPFKLHTPRYHSIAALLEALHTTQSRLIFIAGGENTELITAMQQASLTVKMYLWQLQQSPANKTLNIGNVIDAFSRIGTSWQAADAELQKIVPSHDIRGYEESIAALLQNPEALRTAGKEVYLSASEFAEELLK